MVEESKKKFGEKYLYNPQITVQSPGRINLIGEHTDYNNGYVLPGAINKSVFISIAKRSDRAINLFSIDKEESFSTTVDLLERSNFLWPDYINGVVNELIKAGHILTGFDAAISGDIPIGAGLSSSAAVECATVFALNNLFSLDIDKIEMVKIAQRAENNFVDMKCGIMDQFASMMGQKGKVIKLDCDTLAYDYFPFEMKGFKVVLYDTKVKHSLASSEYNTRRKESAEGLSIISTDYENITSFRDVDITMVENSLKIKFPILYKRCKYIVEENARVLSACKDLENLDLEAFGKKMNLTHHGLSKLYEVSCPELDCIAETIQPLTGVLGARMMGGGFGGCVIALIKDENITEVTNTISQEYNKYFEKTPTVYITEISNGTEICY